MISFQLSSLTFDVFVEPLQALVPKPGHHETSHRPLAFPELEHENHQPFANAAAGLRHLYPCRLQTLHQFFAVSKDFENPAVDKVASLSALLFLYFSMIGKFFWSVFVLVM